MPLSLPNKAPEHVVFLDRDGVINRDSPAYIKSLPEFEFLPRSLAAVQKLTDNHFKTIIITNQSALNRGMISKETLDRIHATMIADIRAHGGEIDDIFFCPHTPQEDCSCRKPEPGMIHRACAEHKIDLSLASMVGDSAKDIACARRAHVRYAVLVKTGNFARAQRELDDLNTQADWIAADLYDAVDWIIEQFQHKLS